jgi:ABC-type Fe3+ transport system permease subunit
MVLRVFRWLLRWAGTGLWVVVLAPALALLPAAVLDRGPGGSVRPTLFPLALAALDPFLWDCVRNSVVVALIVAAGSLVLGTGLARAHVRWRFWGRPALTALVLAPLAISPLFGAIGLRQLAVPWLASAGTWGGGWPGPGRLAGWIGWVWVGLVSGVPLVALATASALARVDPSWEDAARLAGAEPRRIWRQLVWPIVRPGAARAAGMVFSLTLIEPGAPLVLGLRRTLAFQIVEAALGPEGAPRAVVLALAAAAAAIVGRVLVRWWGGNPIAEASPPEIPVTRAEVARWPRAAWYMVTLAIGAVLAWLPTVTLLAIALAGGAADSRFGWLADPESRRLLVNGLALGLAVVAIDLALVWTLAAWAGRRHTWVLSLAAWPELLPPLALGVGALALPGLLHLGADWARASGTRIALVHGARILAGSLDPYRTPGVLLALAVSATRLPFLARAVEHGWSRFQPALVDAASTLGATPRQARRTATGHWLGAAPAALVLTFALAATNLAPALILAPTIESRPIAPGILIEADEPGAALPRAAALACAAVALNLTGLALAATSRSVRLGDWFRG